MRRVIRELAIGVGIIILLVVIAVTYEGLRAAIVYNRLKGLTSNDVREMPYVADKMQDYNRIIRFYAAQAMTNIGAPPDEAAPALIRGLNDPYRMVRIQSVLTLVNIGADATTIPHLIVALDDGDPLVRNYAAYLLSKSPKLAHAAIPRLVKNLDDPLEAPMAAYVLCSIGAPAKEAIPKIITVFKQVSDKVTLVGLMEGLEKLGGDAKAAIPHLQTLSQDPDPEISKAASKAVQTITAPPAIPMP